MSKKKVRLFIVFYVLLSINIVAQESFVKSEINQIIE